MAFPFLIRRVGGEADLSGAPRGYWIESTAPLEVDVPFVEEALEEAAAKASFNLTPNSFNDAPITDDKTVLVMVDEIAQHLADEPDGELLLAVHGYNNPVDVALRYMTNLFTGLLQDPVLRHRKGMVCLGYHWPSEKFVDPMRDKAVSGAPDGMLARFTRSRLKPLRGAPPFLYAIAIVALAGTVLGAGIAMGASGLPRIVGAVIAALSLFVGTVPVALPLMRTSAYFRDQYRATQYGIPDLVRFFQLLDAALGKTLKTTPGRRIRVSFIGHSMGAFVVTSLVRILSDVFDKAAIDNSDAEASNSEFGDHLRFGRLVLASPDIPAEALKTIRSNFLASSLRRFEDAFLFSNAGDEVLHAISTVANYFSFPSGGSSFGLRLGNVDVRIEQGNKQVFGSFSLEEETFDRNLYVGEHRLRWFLKGARQGGSAALARRFTYVDCTDFRENGHAYLSRALCKPSLNMWDRATLLFLYSRGKVDVHSGYFEDHSVRRLLLRLAMLGWDPTLAAEAPDASDPETAFGDQCRMLQLQVIRGEPRGR